MDGRRIGIRFPVILTYVYSCACTFYICLPNYNEISGGHIWRGLVRRRCSAGPVLPLWVHQIELMVAIAMHCNLTPPVVTSVVVSFNYEARRNVRVYVSVGVMTLYVLI